jgi:hypothetical protein
VTGDGFPARFWPNYLVTVPVETPRLPDGTVDVRSLCRLLDDDYNRQLPGGAS